MSDLTQVAFAEPYRLAALYFVGRYARYVAETSRRRRQPMPRRSKRLQRYIDLGWLDEEDATEMDAVFLQEAEEEAEDDERRLRSHPTLIWPPATEPTAAAGGGAGTQSIVNANCLEYMRGMAERSVDCVV